MQSKLIRVLCVVLVCVFTMTLALGGAAYLTARAENDATAAATAAASGKCGEDLFWSYDPASGILTILGSGAMWDFDSPEDAPWASIASGIKTIAFSTGVTVIGKNAFSGCPVESIQFPETLTEIHENAFTGCEKLAAVDLSTTQVTAIEAGAFTGCPSLAEVALPETATSVSEAAFDEAVAPAQTAPTVAETVPAAPVVPPTEPVAAPTVPVEETKTYTTEENVAVTETWVNGVLQKTVEERPNNRRVVSSDYDDNGNPQSVIVYVGEQEYSTSTYTYDSRGNIVEGFTSYANGNTATIQSTTEEETDNRISVETGFHLDGTKTVTKTVWDRNGIQIEQDVEYILKNGSVESIIHTVYDRDTGNSESVLRDSSGNVRSISKYAKDEAGNTIRDTESYFEGEINAKCHSVHNPVTGITTQELYRLTMNGEETWEIDTVYVSYRDEDGNGITETTGYNSDGKVSGTSRKVEDPVTGNYTTENKDAEGNVTSTSTCTHDPVTGNTTTETVYPDDDDPHMLKSSKSIWEAATGNTIQEYIHVDGSTEHRIWNDGRNIEWSFTDENGNLISETHTTYDQITGGKTDITVYGDGRMRYAVYDSDWNTTLESKYITVDENGNVSSITHKVYDPETGKTTTTTTAVTAGEDGKYHITVTDADGNELDSGEVTEDKLAELAAIPMPGEDTAEAASNGILMAAALEENIEETEEVTEEEPSVEEDSTDETPAEEDSTGDAPAEEVSVEKAPTGEVPTVLTGESKEEPAEETAEKPAQGTTEEPIETAEKSAEDTKEPSAEDTQEEPTEDTKEEPAQGTTEESIETAEKPAEDTSGKPAGEPVEEPGESTDQAA